MWLTTENEDLFPQPSLKQLKTITSVMSLSKETACVYKHHLTFFPFYSMAAKHYWIPSFSHFNTTIHISNFFILFFKCITCIYLYVHEWSCHPIHVEVKGQRAGASSVLLPYRCQSTCPTRWCECLAPYSWNVGSPHCSS